jgi:hypothetical protein
MSEQKRFQWQVRSGDKVTVGGVTVTPQSRALVFHWPNVGGLVWNRPVRVLVEKEGQVVERISIVDITKLAQYILFGFTVIMIVIGFVLSIQRKEEKRP